ncbi:hypothetical protein ACMWP9_32970, partial [Escherichia coli]
MADENVAGAGAAEDDPWGAAMAEQTEAEEAQKKGEMEDEKGISAAPAMATVFKDLSAADIKTNTPNDIDFILDIPVQLTVELG